MKRSLYQRRITEWIAASPGYVFVERITLVHPSRLYETHPRCAGKSMTSKFLPDSDRPEGFMPPYLQKRSCPCPDSMEKEPCQPLTMSTDKALD